MVRYLTRWLKESHDPMFRPPRRPVRPGAMSPVRRRRQRRARDRRAPVRDGVAVTHAHLAEPDPFPGCPGSDRTGVAITNPDVAEPDPFRGPPGPDRVGVGPGALEVTDTVRRDHAGTNGAEHSRT